MTQGEPIGERDTAFLEQPTIYDGLDEQWADEVGEAVLAAGVLARSLRELAYERGHIDLMRTLDGVNQIKDLLADVYRSELTRARRST